MEMAVSDSPCATCVYLHRVFALNYEFLRLQGHQIVTRHPILGVRLEHCSQTGNSIGKGHNESPQNELWGSFTVWVWCHSPGEWIAPARVATVTLSLPCACAYHWVAGCSTARAVARVLVLALTWPLVGTRVFADVVQLSHQACLWNRRAMLNCCSCWQVQCKLDWKLVKQASSRAPRDQFRK